DVHERVGLDTLVYAGSHGFDIDWPDDGTEPLADCTKFHDLLEEVGEALERKLGPVEGVIIEPKSCSVAVHYRLTDEAGAVAVKAVVEGLLASHPRLRGVSGKKVYEILPGLAWDKGKAVLWMLKALDLDGPDVVPIYVGDDITDVDAFNALEGRGIRVYVTDGVDGGAPPAADYCVKDPDEVEILLTFLADRANGGGEGMAR
ncbi:MAG: trehalose-phosphatase, partial [Alphaproteobacteria bacterium]|nr:trehalose-phosphatase [Alphaproteobacteria bacterium]